MSANGTVFARPGARAVIYLRVSSRGQVDTDYDPEGNSIPAQRKACLDLARRLGLTVVDEYVDPGKSGRSIDGRPAFRSMMGRVRHGGDVDCIIVYTRSRLFRDATDAALTKRDLRRAEVAILSVKDPTDDSPTGELMAHMVDGFNEYQSRISGQDVAYKMEAKAARGGTPGRAPLGYANVRDIVDGREVRTIAIDPDRASVIVTLFERYATGQYSYHQLRQLALSAGLRTRPTRRHPVGTPLSINKIGSLLRDPYYLGVVTFNGVQYPGRHEPLIDRVLFDKVQTVLTEQRGAGTRERRWHHYLKGLVWCGRCGRRLILEAAVSGSGRRYFYFLCLGRNARSRCDLPRMTPGDVEAAVEAHFATVAFSLEDLDRTRERLDAVATTWQRTATMLRTNIKREHKRLRQLESHLLELVGQVGWPVDVINAKISETRQQHKVLGDQLQAVAQQDAGAREQVEAMVNQLAQPRRFYAALSDDDRRTFAKICFDRIDVDVADDSHAEVAPQPLTAAVDGASSRDRFAAA